MSQKKRIESIYALKCLCCFFVVLLHTDFFAKEELSFISGIGTPCFYAITGYLLYCNNKQEEISKCIKWAKKTLITFILCNLLYIIFYLILDIFPQTDFSFWWKNIIMGNRVCFSLWYLAALWEGLLIIAFIRKYNSKTLYALPFLFIVIYLIRNSNTPLLPYSLAFCSRLSILTSLPFLATGYLIHKHHNSFRNLPVIKILTVLTILAIGENVFYAYYLDHHGLFHISTYPLIVTAILLCLKYPDFHIPYINTIGKIHSPNIYYFHPLVMIFWSILDLKEYNYVQAIIVWLFCIPVSMLFCFLQTHILSFYHTIRTKYLNT